MASKIFGIGLSKTGTTSLANALQVLGYKTKDNMGVVKYATGDLSSVDLHVVDANHALTDTPIPSFYRELDARYPGSKFILTVRESEGWLKSCKKQFTQRFAGVQTDAHKQLFIDLYDTDVFDSERFASGYARFVDGVREYFKDRPHDLLTINVAAGEGWEKLCPFLEQPAPDVPFPKANVTQVRWMNIDDVVAVATLAGEELMRRYEGEQLGTGVGSGVNDDRRVRTAKQLFERTVLKLRGDDPVHAAVRAAHRVVVKGLTRLNPQIPVLSRAGELVPYDVRREWAGDSKRLAAGAAVTREPSTLTGQRNVASSCALVMCTLAERAESSEAVLQPSMEWQTAAAHAILNPAGLRVFVRESGSELSYNKRDLSNSIVQVR